MCWGRQREELFSAYLPAFDEDLPDLLRTLAIPTGSCCACGLLAFGLEKICLPHLGAMVTVLLELVITGAVYWFLLLMLRSFRGQDLNYVPGGKVLRAFGKTLRLL